MKKLLFIIISFALISNESVLLRWKINEGEDLTYKVSQSINIENKKINEDRINEYSDKLNEFVKKTLLEMKDEYTEEEKKALFDSIDAELEQNKSKMKTEEENYIKKKIDNYNKVDKIQSTYKFTYKDNNNMYLSIVTESDKIDNNIKEDIVFLNDLSIDKLNGQVFNTGDIWIFKNELIPTDEISEDDKKKLSLILSLPKQKVEVGDSWEVESDLLDSKLITRDQLIKEISNNSKGEATLISVESVDDKLVATIEYNINQNIEGESISQVIEEGIPVQININYKATGLFDVDKGRWIDYNGEMLIDENYLSNFHYDKKFNIKMDL